MRDNEVIITPGAVIHMRSTIQAGMVYEDNHIGDADLTVSYCHPPQV